MNPTDPNQGGQPGPAPVTDPNTGQPVPEIPVTPEAPVIPEAPVSQPIPAEPVTQPEVPGSAPVV